MTSYGDELFTKDIHCVKAIASGSVTAPAVVATTVTGNVVGNVDGNISGEVRLEGTAPTVANAAGTAGDIRWTGSHIYICVTTGAAGSGAWERAPIATW